MREPLLAIVGPTAVGKTRLSLELAQELKGEIISADSMQVYKGMDIGTAKASKEEQELVPHHLIDIIDPKEEFSVADFQKRADSFISRIYKRGKLPMLVGGTGLYFKAVIEGFIFPDMEIDWELRRELEGEAERLGNETIHNKLEEIDPDLAAKLHPNDLRRVIRGIEVYNQTGKTTTHFKRVAQKREARYKDIKIGLKRDRDSLYRRIDKRVDLMMEEGLVEEVRELYNKGYNRDLISMQGLGYKEVLGFFSGDYDLKEATRLIKRDTRHFAKRQFTWFNRDKSITWFDVGNYKFEDLLIKVKDFVNHKMST